MKKHTKILVAVLTVMAVLYMAAGCAASPAASNAPAPAYQAPASQAPATQAPAYQAPTSQAAASQAPALCPPQQNYAAPQPYDTSSEEYGEFIENGFKSPGDEPLSTFSIDVDTASYSTIRRYVGDGMLPPADAVRLEECVNYFPYSYEAPGNGEPVGIGVTISRCPWNEGRCLARITLKAREIDPSRAPVSNLVFLLDVSGSMNSPDKLPLVQHAISMLTEQISGSDRVSIVVYAGNTGVVLEGCSGENKAAILSAVESLSAGGTTAGAAGIELAYDIAQRYYLEGGNNRVILCTDGDFNVGISSPEELEALIAEKSKSGVYLSVMGFGTGNVKDNRMETLADKGNGNYAYIDSEAEAEKVFAKELLSTLFAVAKDVKVQVEFNPKAVKEYRLLGYDNRMLNAEDFNNDNKDAGEMGAGSCVTAFYEIIPINSSENSSNIDDLVFQDEIKQAPEAPAADWLYVKVRYKQPSSDESRLLTLMGGTEDFTLTPDDDFKFASAVAEFALLLRGSDYAGKASFSDVISRATASLGRDEGGYRSEFIELASMAARMY